MTVLLGCPKATDSGVCYAGAAGIAIRVTRDLLYGYGLNLQLGTMVLASELPGRYNEATAW